MVRCRCAGLNKCMLFLLIIMGSNGGMGVCCERKGFDYCVVSIDY